MKAANFKKTDFIFALCIIGYLCMVFLNTIFQRLAGSGFFIGNSFLSFSNFNGVVLALQVMFCVIMVATDHKRGVIIATFLMSISFLYMCFVIFVTHSFSPLPGLANLTIGYLVVLLLNRQFGRIEKDVVTDALTGLKNRRGMLLTLQKMTTEKRPFYLLYIDLDDFKFINDTLGHNGGDEVLKIVTQRMKEAAGKNGSVNRIAADEFVMIANYKVDIQALVEEVVRSISTKMSVSNSAGNMVDCYLTASIGVAGYPEHAKDSDTLLKYADIAMYQAKKQGKNKYFVFDKTLENAILRQTELEGLIKEGLDKGYFHLVYQPQFHTQSKKLRGFETLLRMTTPEGGSVSPGEFIPAAERTDLIMQIDDYVMRHALREAKGFLREEGEDFLISINVSAKNMDNEHFAQKVQKVLEEENFPAKCLEIEITEYCFAQSLDVAFENIDQLKKLGVQIALDDFGTGYASLSYLSRLPIDLLKIDKSFIDHIAHDRKSKDFVNAVTSIGHLHGCQVISEGVENEEQLQILKGSNCDFIQGFVWGKPQAYEDAKALCE